MGFGRNFNAIVVAWLVGHDAWHSARRARPAGQFSSTRSKFLFRISVPLLLRARTVSVGQLAAKVEG